MLFWQKKFCPFCRRSKACEPLWKKQQYMMSEGMALCCMEGMTAEGLYPIEKGPWRLLSMAEVNM